MLLDATMIASMISDLGGDIVVDGIAAKGIFYEPGKQIVQFDGSVSTSDPYLVVDAATAETITVNDTVITVNGTEYLAVNIQRDRAGWYGVNLTRDF